MSKRMDFEWDEDKNVLNLQKHGVDFMDAMLIFENITLSAEDNRRDYGERRFRSIGMVDDDCFVVVYTQRGDVRRLISAWKGGSIERQNYRAHVLGRSKGET